MTDASTGGSPGPRIPRDEGADQSKKTSLTNTIKSKSSANASFARGRAARRQGNLDRAVEEFARATVADPENAAYRRNHASALYALGRYEEAVAAYREVIRRRPDGAVAHKGLGTALAGQNKLDEAIACYREAIRLRADDAGAYNALGNALRILRSFDEAIAAYDRALELNGNQAGAWNHRGVALARLGRYDEAIASYTRCIKLRPKHLDAHLNRASAWLVQGNFAQGWAEYEWRLCQPNVASQPPTMPAWNGYPPRGMRLLLVHEMGLGDSIHFIRYAPLLKRLGATVIYECPKGLMTILAKMPGIDILFQQGQEPPEHDFYVSLLSLPGLMGMSLESIPLDVPYIEPDPALVERWRLELAQYPELKVGINWQGNPGFPGDAHRSIPLCDFQPLGQVPGVRLFSLQKNVGHEQLAALGDAFPVVDLGARLDIEAGPFMDTAAVLRNLDLFITSDTALAHLAGALGVPVWLATSAAPEWQWMLDREDSPWYPTMRLFRQERLMEWAPVFKRMASEVAKLVPPAPEPKPAA
ncbi:tetratricopeptide repeat protein [Singulisphaera rosea]